MIDPHIPCHLQVYFAWESEGILYDRDGTLTGHAGHSVIPYTNAIYDKSKCVIDDAGMFSQQSQALICNNQAKFVR